MKKIKRLLVLNSVAGIKSTGRIAIDIIKQYEDQGYECKIIYGRETIPKEYGSIAYKIGNKLDLLMHVAMTRLFDRHGLGSVCATKKLLKWMEKFNPDIIWLHNLHGYYINYEILFDWIKTRPEMEVKWTLHDCWAFTGHCVHFEDVQCEMWKTGCSRCPNKKLYPQSLIIDNSENNYIKKKEAFSNVKNMTIYTPSYWLANLVRYSFLGGYNVIVNYNKIDLKAFKPRESDFRDKAGIFGKVMILGVASSWSKSKGLLDFLKLRKLLSDEYAIVIVGLNNKQMKKMPSNIVSIGPTHSKQELAEIYTAADYFVNFTYADTYPTVNLEAQACGTPVITYRTGGSPESVPEGNVVNVGDVAGVAELIKRGNLKAFRPDQFPI